jgi:FMN-dependent NADH-azoreductase
VSRQVADTAQAAWQQTHRHRPVVRRDLGANPVPTDAWALAVSATSTPEAEQIEAQRRARELAATLVDELAAADAYLFAVPLYNYGVSQHFKVWVDLVLTDPRLAPGNEQLLAGRPATLVTARGGGYGAGTPREGWDHSTPWLVRILADVLGLDLKLSEAELTLAGVNPAMASLRGLAAESLQAAHHAADEHGQFLADRVGARTS